MNRKKRRISILLSAFLYPGVGQFVQGRTKAGLFYTGLFTVGLVFYSTYSAEIIGCYYGLGMDFNHYQPPAELPAGKMIAAFAFALTIYVANIVDAFRGARRV